MIADEVASTPATSVTRDLAGSFPIAVAGACASTLAVVAIGQVPPMLLNAAGGGLAVSTQLKVGWFYTMAGHAVAIRFSGAGSVDGFGAGELSVRFGMLTIAVLAIACLALSGRAAARSVEDVGLRRLLAGTLVAIPYAAILGAVDAAIELRLVTDGGFLPETTTIAAPVWEAFALPAALALAAAGLGGWSTSQTWDRGAGRAVRAGLRSFVTVIAVSLAATLAFAALRPEGLERYSSEVWSAGPQRAALYIGHHALALPNHAMWILAPSMGSCVSSRTSEAAHDLLCLDRIPRGPDPATWLLSELGRTEGSPPTTPMPAVAWLFLAMAALALALGFRTAGRAATSIVGAAALGGAGGACFAVLVIVTSLAGSLWVRTMSGEVVRTVGLGPDPVRTAILAGVWGVVGGMVACVGWRLSRSIRPR